jgi:hypothetical protein
MGCVYISGCAFAGFEGQSLNGTTDAFVCKLNEDSTVAWVRLLGASGAYTNATGVGVDLSGNVYISGITSGSLPGKTLKGKSDLYFAKYDSAGTIQWVTTHGAVNQYFSLNAMVTNGEGQCFATGSVNQDRSSEYKFWYVECDATGTLQTMFSLSSFPTISEAFACGSYITLAPDNYVYILGSSNGPIMSDYSEPVLEAGRFILKMKVNRGVLVSLPAGLYYPFVDSGLIRYSCDGIASDADGNMYITAQQTHGEYDATGVYDDIYNYSMVRKLKSDFTTEWTKPIDIQDVNSFVTRSYNITTGVGGSVYVCGSTGGALNGEQYNSSDGEKVFLMKFNATGERQWTRLSGSSANAVAAAVNSWGNIFMTGVTYYSYEGVNEIGVNDSFVVKYSAQGAIMKK